MEHILYARMDSLISLINLPTSLDDQQKPQIQERMVDLVADIKLVHLRPEIMNDFDEHIMTMH